MSRSNVIRLLIITTIIGMIVGAVQELKTIPEPK